MMAIVVADFTLTACFHRLYYCGSRYDSTLLSTNPQPLFADPNLNADATKMPTKFKSSWVLKTIYGHEAIQEYLHPDNI